MKLVMSLLVRDGIDMVRENLRFHLDQGVDHVVVIDNGSVDGTRDVLLEFEKAGVLTLVDEPSQDFSQSKWMTRAAFLARDQLGAGWVLNNDVDEFWYTAGGDLKAVIDPELDMLLCPRKEMVFAWDEPDDGRHWSERLIYKVEQPVPIKRPDNFYDDPLYALYGYFQLLPKVLTNTRRLRQVTMGNHGAEFDGSPRVAESEDILIYHYSTLSVAHFEHKVIQGGEAYLRNTEYPEHFGWHWRRFYRKVKAHGVEAAIAEALPTRAQIEQDLLSGRLQQDLRMRDLLRRYR